MVLWTDATAAMLGQPTSGSPRTGSLTRRAPSIRRADTTTAPPAQPCQGVRLAGLKQVHENNQRLIWILEGGIEKKKMFGRGAG